MVEEDGVVAGTEVVSEVFRQLSADISWELNYRDGDRISAGQVVMTVKGPLGAILSGERVALNFLQRLAGIATATRCAVDAVAGTGALITDTRKTTPGLRFLERAAVRAGGGVNHRFSLGDAILWKDNHWAALARTGKTLAQALAAVGGGVPVIVEVENEIQLDAAITAAVPRILIDNQSVEVVARWAARCTPGTVIEVSGGITAANARGYALAGAKYLSIGSLTHSVRALSVRLDLEVC